MRRQARAAVAGLLAAVVLAGCTILPDPLTSDETEVRVETDLESMFGEQAPIDGPLTLHEAMARAVLYNLDSRVRAVEQALSLRQLDYTKYELLPSLDGSAGLTGRTNKLASSSESVDTGDESLETSTSQEENRFTGDLTTVWNVLDFGVSYVAAEQQADRSLIAYERRRKVIHTIIQDVRAAFWRAVAAERLLSRIEPLMARVEAARRQSERIEELRLRAPIEALSYQRALLEVLQELEAQRRELVLAKTELAALINLPPDRDFVISMPDESYPLPDLALEMSEFETLALAYRPEQREEQYQSRITAAETQKAMLRMLPGIELNGALAFDTNDFLLNNNWADYGVRITWNLFDLFTGPTSIKVAEAQEEVAYRRRLALSMAVLTQLYVARANYEEARRRFLTAEEMSRIDARILEQLRSAGLAQQVGELAVIQAELNALQAALERDLTYAELRNAYGQIFVAVGADPLPQLLPDTSLESVAEAISKTEDGWGQGEIFIQTPLGLETASAG